MIKKIPGETWKPLMFPGWKQLRKKYGLSSSGRVASYYEDIYTDGKLLNGSVTTGYKTLNLHRPGNNGTLYLHREIARMFVKKSSPKQKYVIHLNHNKTDNSVKNLKWVSLDDMILHQQKSPAKPSSFGLSSPFPIIVARGMNPSVRSRTRASNSVSQPLSDTRRPRNAKSPSRFFHSVLSLNAIWS